VKLSQRSQTIKPSPTLSVTARAAQLKAEGRDIISLAAGEPDFDTPDHIKEAAIKAIRDGFTKYTDVSGTAALKAAIVAKLGRENQLSYKPSEVLVSVGCKHSIYNLAQALLNPGHEVIIPSPYWVSYPDIVRLAGAEPVYIHTDISTEFKISPDQLKGAISDKTRLLILNSPSNPTGSCYSGAELAALAEVLREHPEVVIASDDIYEHVLWAEVFPKPTR
jgi:aspartate aminotransferase